MNIKYRIFKRQAKNANGEVYARIVLGTTINRSSGYIFPMSIMADSITAETGHFYRLGEIQGRHHARLITFILGSG